ncbi:hypothetical protein MEQU1_001658 [Malassezia equina]|uniref:Importin N-terminal domain-containing protein n=1 Tax=Malassezia equina TaxID=1381935 RepID=A0AAF0IYI0_9BASI|nr:hypothetical protein MEQU1_001658 [Malassezia equina]
MSVAFSAHALRDTLVAATFASDAHTLQSVEAQLDAWETESTYWEELLRMALDPNEAPGTTLRQLAIIRFKNGIMKYWRARIVNRVSVSISKESKERIRTCLLRVLHEPDRAVAVQAAVAISKLARTDYPSEWPDLVPTLQAAIESAGAAIHEAAEAGTLAHSAPPTRVLLIAADVLRQCLKEFQTVRVLSGKMRMAELARTLLPALQPVFERLFEDTFTAQDAETWAQLPGTVERVRASHLLLKVSHRLAMADNGIIASKVSEVARPNLAFTFFACTPSQLSCLVQRRVQLLGTLPGLDTALTKHMMAYAKFHLALVTQLHSHVATWPAWVDVVDWYWNTLKSAAQSDSVALSRDTDNDAVMYPHRWIVLSLVLLRTTLNHWKRQRPSTSCFGGAEGAVMELQVTDTLLQTYLRLTPSDLERWQAEPEMFAVEEAQADASLDIRPAAEQLLIALSDHSTRPDARQGPSVAEHVWAQFQASAQWPTTLEGAVARDALYTALGLCRDRLDSELNEEADSTNERMAQAIHDRFLPEAAMEGLGAPWLIVRRRIAWLLWEWSEYVWAPMRPRAYVVLVQLLTYVPGRTDVAVQLAAARTLSALTDALEFDADVFAPYLGDAITVLMHLLAHDLQEMDSIRTVASTLAVVIERVGPRIQPYAGALLDMLPRLWALEDPSARTKPSLLECLCKLVEACAPRLQDQPLLGHMHTLVAHVVRASLEPDLSPLIGYDALLLWARTLQASPQLTPSLIPLLALAPAHVTQPDFGPLLCRVWEESVALAPTETWQMYALDMYTALASVLNVPDSPVLLGPLHALDAHVRVLDAAHLGPLAEILHTTGLGTALFSALLREESFAMGCHIAVVVARLAVYVPHPYFHELMRASRSHNNALTWPALLEKLVNYEQGMALLRPRKLLALAMASILQGATEQDTDVWACVPSILGAWTELLGEIVEDEHGHAEVYEREASPDRPLEVGDEDDLLLGDDLGGALQDDSPAAARAAALRARDVVQTVPLRPCLANTLNVVLSTHPVGTPQGDALHQSLHSMDPLVLEMLQRDLNKPPASST